MQAGIIDTNKTDRTNQRNDYCTLLVYSTEDHRRVLTLLPQHPTQALLDNLMYAMTQN